MGSIDLTCPNCGHHEEAMIGPTFSIGGRFDITVKNVNCSECGYDGRPRTEANRRLMMSEDNEDIEPTRGVLKPKGENDLADRIREAIGAGDDERVEITTPQFERRDGVDVDWVPEDRMDIYGLSDADDDTLKELGLRKWADDLWLFPAEWYDHIPDGTLVETINERVEEFSHGKTDDDRRFGVLSYGIRNGENAP